MQGRERERTEFQHVPEQNTFIGEQFYLFPGPLFDEFKKQHNALGTWIGTQLQRRS
ncbi:hypothetical protein VP01_5794g1 [Puccinia sorghi]|uniref:Uncharacterized protein n=1 Tax=Puccinia sorghi TaxID=27349 RepID=A0A0L6UI68_9BASI|nr:hypothetical protein VP01_5794g1 [Puccinia sorghi]